LNDLLPPTDDVVEDLTELLPAGDDITVQVDSNGSTGGFEVTQEVVVESADALDVALTMTDSVTIEIKPDVV